MVRRRKKSEGLVEAAAEFVDLSDGRDRAVMVISPVRSRLRKRREKRPELAAVPANRESFNATDAIAGPRRRLFFV